MGNDNAKKQERDRIGKILLILYVCFLAASVVLVLRIVYLQAFYKVPERLDAECTPRALKSTIQPRRGAILASDGRLLAISIPRYDIAIDPSVQKVAFSQEKNAAELEKQWQDKAWELCKELPKYFPNKTADEWFKMILDDRNSGKKYRMIARNVEYKTKKEVESLPLFREGRNKGGIIVEEHSERVYPYGSLGRSVIGYVRTVDDETRARGLEGKFNHKLHGVSGVQWKRITDGRQRVRDNDSTFFAAEDGLDLKTTIDVDLQDFTDRALRKNIGDDMDIEGACAIIMDVRTGAIRTMVNLHRDDDGRLTETYNYAVARKANPGSVFKAATLMTCIEDGYVRSLDDVIPSNHGFFGKFEQDRHIVDYERENHATEVPILYGLSVSSNYVFRYLAVKNYGNNPEKFLDRLYTYKFGESYADFDLDGMAAPAMLKPDTPGWSGTALGSIAIGYSVEETPMHILTFYNAIANKGRMMKPYLVEGFEKNGMTVEKRGPSELVATICKKATADTLTRGLMAVTDKGGTASLRLGKAKVKVAGKTGTSRSTLTEEEAPGFGGQDHDALGRKKNNATFVGFFPAEAPEYSMIVVAYSKLSGNSFYGGTIPAQTVRDVVDKIYAIESGKQEVLHQNSRVPDMKAEAGEKPEPGIVPDVKGMGIQDAIFAIENAGYRCSYTGVGHVRTQSPAAGSKANERTTIQLTLK